MSETITLPSCKVVIDVPENAVALRIEAKVYRNGELSDVVRVMTPGELRDAIRDAEENYMDPEAVYCLTDEAKKELGILPS